MLVAFAFAFATGFTCSRRGSRRVDVSPDWRGHRAKGMGAITPKKHRPSGGLAGQSQEREVCPSRKLMSRDAGVFQVHPKRKNGPPVHPRSGRFVASGCVTVRLFKE